MTRISENGARLGAKTARSVVVVHEDAAARERAVEFCDQLVRRFWARFEFEVSWCSFAQLEEAGQAKAAAEKAAGADLVVFCATPEGDFPLVLKGWVERWLRLRGEREGMLVGLVDPANGTHVAEGPKHHWLRGAARRLGMDYLTQVPHDLSRTMPDSLDSYTSRADQVTGLLADILRRQTPPPGPLP